MKKISKRILWIILGFTLGLGVTVLAVYPEWRGTDEMRAGKTIKAFDIRNNLDFLHQKLVKFSCPNGEALQEIDLLTGNFKCSGGSGGGGGSNPPITPKKYQPPVVTSTGLNYRCSGGLETCMVPGTNPIIKNCLQAGANQGTGRVCSSSRTFCQTSFRGAIWGQKPAGDQGLCILGDNPNEWALKQWERQGNKPASWCRGYKCGTNDWCRDGVVTIYSQACQ